MRFEELLRFVVEGREEMPQPASVLSPLTVTNTMQSVPEHLVGSSYAGGSTGGHLRSSLVLCLS